MLLPLLFRFQSSFHFLRCGLLGFALALQTGCAPWHFLRPDRVQSDAADVGRKTRAENYFVKAREFEMLGLSKKALSCYESAYALDPRSKVLRDLLVEKYCAVSQYSKALLLIKSNTKPSDLSDEDKRACAGIYLRQGKIGLVTDMLEQIHDKRPEEYQTLGLVYESKGNLSKAIQWYTGLLRKKPESLQMWLKTAGLYSTLKRYSEAESLFIEMERRFGQSPEVFNGIGLIKLAKGDTALAINSFATALLIDSTFEEGNRNIAQIYIHRGKWEQALPYYEKLYAGSPAGSYGKSLGMLYYYSKKYEKAVVLLSQLIADKDDDIEVRFYRGLSFAAIDSIQEARSEFEEVLRRHGDFTEAWQQLCFLSLKAKDYDRALSIADSFTAKMPRLATAWRMAGYIYNARKEYSQAIDVLKKALDLDSSDALAWFELGTCLERTKDREKAAMAFRRVLSINPGDPSAANYLAYMWAEQGINLDSARVLLKMALAQDSLNGAFLDSYAWIYYKMGLIDTAAIYIGKALGRLGDDPILYTHYGDIYAKKGDYAAALKAYKKGLQFAAPDKITPEEIVDLKSKINEIEKKVKNKGGLLPAPAKTDP